MFLVLALAAVPFVYDGQLRPGQSLTVRDINGDVRVRTGDRLAIRATKHADHGDPNDVAILVENRSDGIVVCVRYPPETNRGCDERKSAHSHSDRDNDTAVDFEITVPHGINLNASSVNGSVDAMNDGPTEASTVNGSVQVQGRDVRRAASVNGSVRVKVLDRSRGSLTARTVNGSIDVTLAPGNGVAFDARTLTGGINAEGITVDHPRWGPGARASGTLGDGALRISAETVNGSITLRR
jgi:hypothetical protein